MKNFQSLCALPVAFSLLLSATSCHADGATTTSVTEEWKTAYYKRGFVGGYQTSWASGLNSTIRSRVIIPFNGSKVRMTLNSVRETATAVTKITLARGNQTAAAGVIEGTSVPINFAGVPTLAIPANGSSKTSDIMDATVQSGIWYLQQSYNSPKIAYAYGIDGFFHQAGDQHNTLALANVVNGGIWAGNVFRIEVLTSDTRPTILCYGDSITHGYKSTPNGGKAYPEVLGNLTNRPTLNLGVNGDLLGQTANIGSTVNQCKGVDTVIMLMGINDILNGSITTTAKYSSLASAVITSLKTGGKKVYWGTILPAGGNPQFDAAPAKETLRQSINTWIRANTNVDGVIDFDVALRDPANPYKIRTSYQTDWIHPNDAGYQKMAETAAPFFTP